MADNFTVTGTIEIDTQKAKEGIIALDAKIDEISESQKEAAKQAKAFSDGMGKGSDNAAKSLGKAGESLGTFTSMLKSMGPLGEKLGNTIGKVMSGPTVGGIRMATLAMGAFQAAMGPILIVIRHIVAAVKLIGGAISKAAEKQKEFEENTNRAKTALEGVEAAADGIGNAAEKAAKKSSGMEKSGAAASIVFEKFGNWLRNVFRPIVDGILGAFNFIGDAVAWFADKLGLATAAEVELALNAQKVAEQTQNINDATEDYNTELRLINKNLELGRITQEEADDARLKAQNGYLDALMEERDMMVNNADADKRIDANSEIVRQLDMQIARIAEQTGLINEQKAATEEKEKQELSFAEKRDQIIGEMNRNLAYQNELNLDAKDLQEAQNRIREQAIGQLDSLYAGAEATRENAAASFKIYDDIKNAITETKKEKEKEITLDDIARQHEEAMAKARADRNAAIAAGLDPLKAEKDYATAISNANMSAAQAAYLLAENLDRQSPEWEEAQQAAEDYAKAVTRAAEEVEKMSNIDMAGQIAGMVGEAGQNVLAVTERMGQDQIESIQKTLEAARELIDAEFERSMAMYEEQRNRALEMAGFIAATSEQGQEEAMAAAEATMDQQIIDREKRRQEELAINKQYDDLEKEAQAKKEAETKAAEKKAAQETADIQFKQATADWTLRLSQVPVQIAASIMQAQAQLGPLFGAAAVPVAVAMGAAQLAAMMAAMPKKATVAFANGGAFAGAVVDRPTRFTFAHGGEFRQGLMGEAGAEAIMPLERMADGVLGVNASGAGTGGGEPVYAVSPQDLQNYFIKLINDGNGDMIQMRRISP